MFSYGIIVFTSSFFVSRRLNKMGPQLEYETVSFCKTAIEIN